MEGTGSRLDMGIAYLKGTSAEPNIIDSLAIKHDKPIPLQHEQNGEQDKVKITKFSVMDMVLKNFLKKNPMFESDAVLKKLTELSTQPSSWNELSESCMDVIEKLHLKLDNCVELSNLRRFLFNQDSSAASKMAISLIEMLSNEFKTVSGRLANGFLYKSLRDTKLSANEKAAIERAYKDMIPNDLLIQCNNHKGSLLHERLLQVCTRGLNDIKTLESILVNDEESGSRICFLVVYVFVNILHTLLNVQSDELMSLQKNVCKHFLGMFFKKYQSASLIREAESAFEKQRETNKQQQLFLMKNTDKVERDLLLELKKRNLVNLQDLVALNSEGAVDERGVFRGEEIIVPGERDAEVISNIMHNQGEGSRCVVKD